MNEKLIERIVVVVIRLSLIWANLVLADIFRKANTPGEQAGEGVKRMNEAHNTIIEHFFKEK